MSEMMPHPPRLISRPDELPTAIHLARTAGAAAMRFYGTATAEAKADASPVTEADRASNAIIVEGLRRAFPDDQVLSEESRDSAARLTARRVWIVDPLDGTKEFLAQNGEFSVMIALVEDGVPVLGVVHLPDGDVLYSAARGEGAWVERGGGAPERLRCASVAYDAPLRLVGSRSHADPLVERIQHELGITDVAPCGSVGVKCGRIAEGRRDLYIHPVAYMKEWDTAAPEVVLREAGGTVTDCRGLPLEYNKPDPRQPYGILACAPGVVERVGGRVAEVYGVTTATARVRRSE